MKILNILFMMSMLLNLCIAQDNSAEGINSVAPLLVNPENQWNVAHYSMFGGVENYRYSFDSDSSFRNGIWYTELLLSREEMGGSWTGTGQHFRTEGSKVYELIDDTDYLLYDFALNVGDTFTVEARNTWSEPMHLLVTTVDSIELMDQTKRKRLVFKCPQDAGDRVWVEGIGDLAGLLSVKTSCYIDINNRLSCFSEGGDLLYQDQFAEDCWIITSTEDVERRELSIHPNPARDNIQISGLHPSEAINYTIFSNTGIIIRSGKTRDHTLSVGTLPPGLYLLELHTQDQKVTKKFVKVN